MNQQRKTPAGQGEGNNVAEGFHPSTFQPNHSTQSQGHQVRSYSQLTQPVSFAGLPYGATDIDLLCEWHDVAFIFADLKYRGANLSGGQRIAFPRIIDAVQASGREAVFLKVAHNTTEGTIDAAAGIVTQLYHRGQWRAPKQRGITLAELQALFIHQAEQQYNGGRP